jgi:DNA-binding beta-propeller fold protein YncE
VDLAGVQSMTIDGNIWLLYADGRVLKFFAGEQKAFEIRNLPDPLRGPTALAAPVDGNQIYIADAGNGRIIELDKDGLFQRQLRPSQGDVLRGMRYLTLDATTGRFYILTGDKLYRADLPKPAPLPTPTPTPTR